MSLVASQDKDAALRRALLRLRERGLDSPWLAAPHPYLELQKELTLVSAAPAFQASLQRYLRMHEALPRVLAMFFNYLSLALRADWKGAPEHFRAVAGRSWFLGRWVPTFLVVDGPIGRFLFADSSPLKLHFGPDNPCLTSARDLMADRAFHQLRTAIAQWSFEWDLVGSEQYVVALDFERDAPIVKVHVEEADAFHVAAFELIYLLNVVLLKGAET